MSTTVFTVYCSTKAKCIFVQSLKPIYVIALRRPTEILIQGRGKRLLYTIYFYFPQELRGLERQRQIKILIYDFQSENSSCASKNSPDFPEG